MKCVSFNVNSVRLRLHQLSAVVATHQPDFIGLQETKVTDSDFPVAEIQSMGYHVEFFGQKTHYGVALLSKHPFKNVCKGFIGATEDDHKRFISGTFTLPNGQDIHILNGYFPQGESSDHPVKFPNKRKYYADLIAHLEKHHRTDENLIVMGDMNVSHTDQDIGIGEENRKRWLRTGKCSFLPEEREWLQRVLDWGLVDTFRTLHPEEANLFSWFDYRSRGFESDPKRGLRIDLILASQSLANRCIDAGIDYTIRSMDKPSDHCPIWAQFQI
ncbi:exodeoxyribonuclease III [Saccharophagus sp. K07]|uniref:exodeoxyribonuclease III n=1 Tax=Saccharophagus sp. K07 TaxID=2283636 RepID=UPI001652A3E4|nr:exodeoxyribonuclease III [Saccharophagus sp. K07]MBC6904848.1 exodeoxyribonuclease III [Saccharophagus sp. K07]